MVVNYCTPPKIRLTAYCIASESLITASVVNPNPVIIGSALYLITEIYENC